MGGKKITSYLNINDASEDNIKTEEKNIEEITKEVKVEEKEIKDEIAEIFSKESGFYTNVKKDNDTLRKMSLNILNKIELLLDNITSELNRSGVIHCAELIKSFSGLLKNFNDISNSLYERNSSMIKFEVENFKEKMEILKRAFKDNSETPESLVEKGKASKVSLNDVIDAIIKKQEENMNG